MSYTYDQRKRPLGQNETAPVPTDAPGPDLSALMTGAASPSASQKGQPFDLDATIKAKMENAFGDLSAVRFYRSQAVGNAGAEAVARGNEIAFAPGMSDFSTRAGQERLGHELSHVMSQQSGQVRGRGFLVNSSLEARADREGALAAAGQQIYGGPVTSSLSVAAPSPSVSGAMQAKRKTQQNYENIWAAEREKHRPSYEAALNLPPRDPTQEEKRPWELTQEELDANHFNPTNDPLLAQHQGYVDTQTSPEDAYQGFAMMAGNGSQYGLKDETGRRDWNPYEVDPDHFKAKLKNMLRVVHDYPELRGMVGNMKSMPAPISVMAAGSTLGGTRPAPLYYNSTIDSMGWWGRMKHKLFQKGNKWFGITNQSDMEYTGTHELGHVLNSLLLNPKNSDDAYNDWSYSITADKIVQAALKKVMSKEEFKKLKRFKENDSKKEHLRGQLDLKGSNLYKKGHTSRYGQKNATEFFAEAFADVYTHGKNARPASIAVVQEYESRYKEMKEKPDVKGMDLIPDDDPQDVDELNDSMIAHNPDRQKIKRIYGN